MKTEKHWAKIGLVPHRGIALALFALHRANGPQRGEFLDLIPLIDWCKEVGFDTIQLLPLYDTGADPSPYNPISSCALDPAYLSIGQQTENKIQTLKELYFNFSKSPSFESFLGKHPWVLPYALYKALSEVYGTTSWIDWGEDTAGPLAQSYEAHKKLVDFYAYLQFLCFEQFKKVKAHAEAKGIFLKGDLPILLSPASVDVWANRNLFDLTLVAGAPPDFYNQLGQKWGFPLFRWEQDHSIWWENRFSVVSELFHIYRIDHVVGLFRIWAIEEGKKAIDGFFIPKDPNQWMSHGRKILEMMIDSSPCLPMAEDLGIVPPEVRFLLKELGICSTKIVRWQKDHLGNYIPFNQYEPFSMTSLSTHDMEPLPLWWQRYPEEARPLAYLEGSDYAPTLDPELHRKILKDSMHSSSYFHINPLQEFLLLFPELSWADFEKERINHPGTLNPSNWSYRFKPSLETLISHAPLKKTIQQMQVTKH